jgi:hypothetical protein
MRIVPIFAGKLFAFQYNGEADNEYDRLLHLWNDLEYLHSFLKENEKDVQDISHEDLLTQITKDANIIDEILYDIYVDEKRSLDTFFKQLHNEEYQAQVLSKRKGRKNYLRIYALKIDENCFVITGGAIKLTQIMQGRLHTETELKKINTCKQYLIDNGVFDSDSFFEFLIETT